MKNKGNREFFPDEEPEYENIHIGGWDYPDHEPTTMLDESFSFFYPHEEQRIRGMEEANGSPDGGKNYPIRPVPIKYI